MTTRLALTCLQRDLEREVCEFMTERAKGRLPYRDNVAAALQLLQSYKLMRKVQ